MDFLKKAVGTVGRFLYGEKYVYPPELSARLRDVQEALRGTESGTPERDKLLAEAARLTAQLEGVEGPSALAVKLDNFGSGFEKLLIFAAVAGLLYVAIRAMRGGL